MFQTFILSACYHKDRLYDAGPTWVMQMENKEPLKPINEEGGGEREEREEQSPHSLTTIEIPKKEIEISVEQIVEYANKIKALFEEATKQKIKQPINEIPEEKIEPNVESINPFNDFISKMKDFSQNKELSKALEDLKNLCKERKSLRKNYWYKYNEDYLNGKSTMDELDIPTEELENFENKSIAYAIQNLALYSKKFMKHYAQFEANEISKDKFMETLCEIDSCMMSAIEIVYALDTRNSDGSYRYIEYNEIHRKPAISRRSGNILLSTLYKLIETTRDGVKLFKNYKSKKSIEEQVALTAVIKNLHNTVLPSIQSYKKMFGNVPVEIENFTEDETAIEIQEKYEIPEDSPFLALLNNHELKCGKIAKLWGLFNFSFLNKREKGMAYFLSSMRTILNPAEELIKDLFNIVSNTQSKRVFEKEEGLNEIELQTLLEKRKLNPGRPSENLNTNRELEKVESLTVNQLIRNEIISFKKAIKYKKLKRRFVNCLKFLNKILTEETFASLPERSGSTKGLLYAGKWLPNNREMQLTETEYMELLNMRDELAAILIFIESNGSMHIAINPNRNSKVEYYESEALQKQRELTEKNNRYANLLMLQGVFNSIPDIAAPVKLALTATNAGLNFFNNHSYTSNLFNKSRVISKNLL